MSDAEQPLADIASGAASPAEASPEPASPPPASVSAGDASLLALIDQLAALLEKSDLSEIEVEAGGTGLVLRKPTAIAVAAATAQAGGSPASYGPAPAPTQAVPAEVANAAATPAPAPARPSVKAPLTGIYYGAPAPGSAPYVRIGGEVAVGQVIGLIEAMKLFNEIKSDLAGRVVKVVAENGQLVKAKQPLIEVDPL